MGDALEHGTDDLGPAASPGDPEQGAARAVVPHGGAEPEQRRHEPHVSRVCARGCDVCRVGRRGDDPEVFTEPFHARARRQHDRLDAPRERAALAPRHDGERSVLAAADHGRARGADAHVEHPTRAERDLRHAGSHASLADERALLVAGDPGDRGGAVQRGGDADHAARIHDRRHHRRRDVQRA